MSEVQTVAVSLRQLEKLGKNLTSWFARVEAWFERLWLWPSWSIAAWCIIAAGEWLVALPQVYIVAAATTDPTGVPDNFRYFYSAVAQSIAALGALVFVASFTIAQATARAARVTIIYDVAFQRAVGAVLASVLIPLLVLLNIPSDGGPLTWHKTVSFTTFLLAGVAIAAVVGYALSVPQYLSERNRRRRLLVMLEKARQHEAPAAESLFVCALDQCKEDILGSQQPSARNDLREAVRDLLRLSLEMSGEDEHRQSALNTWRAIAAGTIAGSGARGSDAHAASRDTVRALWQMAGQLLDTGANDEHLTDLFGLIVDCADWSLEAGGTHWAERFWITLREWVALRLADPVEQKVHGLLTKVLPQLVYQAFWLLLEEARRGHWEQAARRIGNIWGAQSQVQRRFHERVTMLFREQMQPGEESARVQALANEVFAEPLAATLVLGGLALKERPAAARGFAETAMGLPQWEHLLKSILHMEGPWLKYEAMQKAPCYLEHQYSAIGGAWVRVMSQDHQEFAVLLRCVLERNRETNVAFQELTLTEATYEWHALLQEADLSALATRFAETGLLGHEEAQRLLEAMRARLEELMRENAEPRPNLTFPADCQDAE